jgi:hypothetical protein
LGFIEAVQIALANPIFAQNWNELPQLTRVPFPWKLMWSANMEHINVFTKTENIKNVTCCSAPLVTHFYFLL